MLPNTSYTNQKGKMGLKSSGGGEIVQVQGGHIIRATGRKDRHSKVFTAKGPRDRRVRLSAHTAIQFYDVQDRLGYDRPSKAVDWLIKKAKASIDKLAELPRWDPIGANSNNAVDSNVESGDIPVGDHSGTSYQLDSSNAYVSQGIASQSFGGGCCDSMKSFFPTTSEDNSMSFQSYPQDLISSSQNQDLCLSLHSLQDPGSRNHQPHSSHDPTLFNGSGPLGFDGGSGGWVEQHHHQDMGRFSRLMGWTGGGSGGNGGEERDGILFNNPPLSLPPQALLLSQQGSTAAYSPRGTLQSSFAPFIRALEGQRHHHQQHPSISGIGLGSDGIVGFYLPSQIPSELHGGASMPNHRASSSSLSPDSSQH